jgi:prephenate dehydrogenase
MKVKIVGDGSFGSFLKELLVPFFELSDDADSVILAVPISAYEDVASKHKGKHLINVCSVQKPSTDICLKHSDRVTSLHPLFGRRTPRDKRFTIWTHSYTADNDTWLSQVDLENQFHNTFMKVSEIRMSLNGKIFTPESHDILMARTHVAALLGAQQLKVLVDRVKDVPDELIPNSFRLMRDFVKTLEDMPQGTVESIMANPFI